MIAIAILVVIILLLVATPWRRLPASSRLWALAAGLNALVFLSMPTTLATSPWRPIVSRVLATSAGLSLVLVLFGLLLWRRQIATSDSGAVWLGPMIVGALPGAFYAFFWVIGPLY